MYRQPLAVVTGATGFLAQNLIARLRSGGWRVYGVSRRHEGPPAGEMLSWEALWNGRDFNLDSISAFFHLAAYRPPDLEDPAFAEKCLEINALWTLRLAELMAEKSRARFLYCSAGNIYAPREEPAREDAPLQLDRRACFYLSSKYLGEVFLERTRRLRGLRATTFRVSSLYGPGMPDRDLVASFSALAREKLPLPLRNQGLERFDLVFVDDVVDLLVRAAVSSANGVFNAGSGESVSVAAVAAVVNEVFENPAGFRLEGSGVAAAPFGFTPLSLQLTRETFGYVPRSLSVGIAQYRRWLDSQGAA